ncbi:hypothetical protein ACSTS3_21555 [Aquimarina muelleri]|uniref:hypothetical protein n=1 Tax=Aquimarina muelleri TaxID=279356 RepID=UPI003F683256
MQKLIMKMGHIIVLAKYINMRNTTYFLWIWMLFGIFSCRPYHHTSGVFYDEHQVKEINFCNLKQFKNQLIKTEIEYTGQEEYWGAKGFEKCDLNGEVHLNFEEYIDKKLKRLDKNPNAFKVFMNVIGVFKYDSINRFGHLNSYPAEIIVRSVDIRLKKGYQNF